MIPFGRVVAAQQSPFWRGEHAVRWHKARGVRQQGAEGTVTLQHVTLCWAARREPVKIFSGTETETSPSEDGEFHTQTALKKNL